ncbi:MAG TPA: class I tRNA ligase family protein, partial [bacterium]|nr:class I tRNA ligase family protein [bacterium]
MLHKIATLNQDVRQAYDNFEFYKVFQLVHNFCSVELSSFYLDIAKDALYTNKKDSVERRGIQTVMYTALDTIVKLMSPIIPFTTEETWKYMNKENSNSIHMECMPEAKTDDVNKDLDDVWAKILI